MPAFASVVLTDAAGTPVNHTFTPTKIENGVALHQDTSGGVAVGFWNFGISLRSPKPPQNGTVSAAGTRVYRALITLDKPTMETLGTNDAGYTPPATVAYISRAKVEFIWPERNTLQDRKDVRAMLVDGLNETYVKNVVEDLQAIY